MKNKKILIPLLLILLAVIIVGIITYPKKKEPEVIKIGAILPLTGPVSMAGEWLKNGIELAVEEINKSGGVNGKKIEIVYGDSKNDAKEGVFLLNKMISLDRVAVVISAMSGVVSPMVDVVHRHKVVLFATLTTLPGLTDRSEWVFRYHVSGEEEAKTMAEFAYRELNLKDIGILFINDEFGVEVGRIFKQYFEELGGKIVIMESFEKEKIDFRPVLQKIKKISPSSIYILGYEKPLGLIIKQARELKINSTILSINALGLPKTLEIAGNAAEDTYCTVPYFTLDSPQENIQRFVKNYFLKFHSSPNFVSAEAYDMIYLLLEAMKKYGYTPDEIRRGLLNIKNFRGLMGVANSLPNGEIIFPVTIRKIQKGTLVKP